MLERQRDRDHPGEVGRHFTFVANQELRPGRAADRHRRFARAGHDEPENHRAAALGGRA